MIPSFAVVEVESPGWRLPRVWLPIFLLWIPALILAPVVLLVVIAACIAGRVNPGHAIAVLWGILSGLSGTRVCVNTHDHQVLVGIF